MQGLVQRLDVVVDEGVPVLIDEPRRVLCVHARIRHALRPCIELRLGGLRLLFHLGQRALDGVGRALHRTDCGKRRGRLLQPLVGGDVKRIKELRDARVRENLLGHGGHLVAHVLGGFLKPFLGHALFPPLEVPRRIGDAPPGGPCGSFQTGQRVLADLLRQCPGNIQKAPGGLAGDLGNPLRERLGLGLPGPVVPSPAHKGVDVRLLIPGKPHVLHFAVHAGVRPPTAAEEGTNPPTEQAADCTAKERTDAGHHGTDGRAEPATNPRACADIWLVGEKQATRKGTEAEPCAGRAERAEKRSLRTKRIA